MIKGRIGLHWVLTKKKKSSTITWELFYFNQQYENKEAIWLQIEFIYKKNALTLLIVLSTNFTVTGCTVANVVSWNAKNSHNVVLTNNWAHFLTPLVSAPWTMMTKRSSTRTIHKSCWLPLKTIGSYLKQSMVNVRILTWRRKFLSDCMKQASPFYFLRKLYRKMKALTYSSKPRPH